MTSESSRLQSALLFGWGLLVSTLIKLQLPDTANGTAVWVVAAWCAFYPFVQHTSLPIRRYWLMMVVVAPLAFVLTIPLESGSIGVVVTIGVLAVSLVAVVVKRWLLTKQRPA